MDQGTVWKKPMKILVTGGSGQLAKCLEDQSKSSNHDFYFFSKDIFDITKIDSCSLIIDKILPDIIINTAAYTNVDLAENESDKAMMVNKNAVSNLIKACSKKNVKIIHISTDFVFDGNSNTPYKTNDKTGPLSVYGKSKLAGENLLLESNITFIIIRTSWVYSQYQRNFVKTMVNLSDSANQLSVVNDQFGCPTSAIQIAKAIFLLLEDFNNGKIKSGIYHFSGSKKCSWFDFSKSIFLISKEIGLIENNPLLKEISWKEYKRDATTPNYSVLDNSKFLNEFNFKKTSLNNDLKEVLYKMKESKNDYI